MPIAADPAGQGPQQGPGQGPEQGPGQGLGQVHERDRAGLLDYLTRHALDEDYAYVSAKRRARAAGVEESSSAGEGRRLGPLGAVMLALFAMLVVVAAVQTSQNAATDAQDREQLAGRVRDAQRQLASDRSALDALRRDVNDLTARELSAATAADGLLQRVRRQSTLAGTRAVRGPGVRVVADDAPGAKSARGQVLDTDLQKLVNGLWAAGAEAIAINGERLTNLSTIRLAGGAITINAQSLRRPYVVSAVGDQNTLPARFAETTSGRAWLDLQRQVGLRLTITPVKLLRLPAARVSLRYATPSTGGER